MKRIIKKVVETIFRRKKPAAHRSEKPVEPVIVRREEHTVSRTKIDEDALKVLNRLVRYNHTAYLVGGGVRDLLLDRPVKDFDIATSAHPNEIKNLFRNCRLIGRRFRLAHILFKGGKVIEVSTFRKQTGFSDDADILIKSDNTFGTPQEDALRRDFTVNGLFYSITDLTVIDYVDGLDDLKRRLIRTIGDPNIRFREDPIRILRGIRLAARLGFGIEPKTRAAMTAHRAEIWKSAAPRIVEEFVRILNQGAAAASFPLLEELGVLDGFLPRFAKAYASPAIRAEVARDLAALDAHQKPRQGLPPGLALAVLYHPAIKAALETAGPDADRGKIAAELIEADLKKLTFPRQQLEKAILLLSAQPRLAHYGKGRMRPAQIATRSWFEEALTLFEITEGDTPEGRSLLRRWRAIQTRALHERRPEAEGPEAAVEGGAEAAHVRGGEEGAPEGGEPGAERPEGARRRSRRRRGGRGRGRGRRPGGGATEGLAESGGPRAEPAGARPLADSDTDLDLPSPAADDETPDQRAD